MALAPEPDQGGRAFRLRDSYDGLLSAADMLVSAGAMDNDNADPVYQSLTVCDPDEVTSMGRCDMSGP